MQIRQITDPGDPAIKAFGELQERTYADPDLLIPPDVLPYMLARQSGARRNFMLVAEDGQGQVVGGTVFHYLGGAARSGFSSYLAVAPAVRGQGLAKRLHQERFAVLDAAAGAEIPGLFIDVVAPERLSPEDTVRERAVGLDPADRRRIFQRMGFRRVNVDYYQPPEG
ncbi:MAG TPA: GNAT family N-acetyltransferase, partial [Symbiobacteriaceae bacterium]|nr:GNAT family N-acetyltransferase [Symbiobacteriaceae bacterium]